MCGEEPLVGNDTQREELEGTRVHDDADVDEGAQVHARTAGYLGMRTLSDPAELAARVPDVDHELLARYLRSCCAVAAGDPAAGPVALAPPSERFHWLTAPRSDVLQSSPVHAGLAEDPARALDELFAAYVLGGDPRDAGAR